jgi:protein-disulfide isomerase
LETLDKTEIEFLDPPRPAATADTSSVSYLIVAVVFLLLGVLIGAVGHDRLTAANQAENADLIQQTVQETIAQIRAEASGTTLTASQRYPVEAGNSPAIGPEDAPITIVEFADFRCHFCNQFHAETLAPLLAAYEGKVRFVYRDYLVIDAQSYDAAIAAECANVQGQFWAYHDLLFENQQALNRDKYIELAATLGLDGDAFSTCLIEEETRDAVLVDDNYARALGLSGTPGFFVNGLYISGAQNLAFFQNVIDQELAAAAEASPTLDPGT